MSTPGAGQEATGPEPDVEGAALDIVVLVPTELDVAEPARRRLVARLAASPPDVVAVAAPRRPIGAGSSAVAEAEWAAVEAGDAALVPSAELSVAGAVAVRSAAGHQVGATTVQLASGPLLIDPGACAFGPGDAAAPDAPGPHVRPPFRWRPVVLFLASEDAWMAPEALRDLANGLERHHVEARLAVPQPVPGPHLTAPCPPTRETYAAVRPDLVVAVDDGALEWAAAWTQDRFTVLVALDAELGDGVELVSWTIGEARGRLRARIGPAVEPGALAALINRLCSGPPPMPPSDDAVESEAARGVAVTLQPSAPSPAPALHVLITASAAAVATGPSGDPGDEHDDDTLADQLGLLGHEVRSVSPDLPTEASADTDLLIIRHPVDPTGLTAWQSRAGSGAHVIVDATGWSLGPDGWPDPAQAALARAAGQVLVSQADQADAWRATGARVLVMPPILTRAHISRLTAAADQRRTPPEVVVGWLLGTQGPDPASPDLAVLEAVSQALTDLLDVHPGASVELLGVAPDSVEAIGELAHHERVLVRSRPPDPGQLAAWTAQIWCPSVAVTTPPPEVFAAGFAGVPTLCSSALGGIDPELTVADPTVSAGWRDRLEDLSDDRARRRWSTRARGRAEALRGTDARAAAVERLVSSARAGRS
jgi:hypothetical protein